MNVLRLTEAQSASVTVPNRLSHFLTVKVVPVVKARPKRRPNAWVQRVTEAYTLARIEWEQRLEEDAIGYAEEGRDFRERFPPPTFKDFLIDLRDPDLDQSDPRFAMDESA